MNKRVVTLLLCCVVVVSGIFVGLYLNLTRQQKVQREVAHIQAQESATNDRQLFKDRYKAAARVDSTALICALRN